MRWQIARFKEVPSTQTVTRALAGSGSVEGRVIIAEAQTEGRGRGSRRWHSVVGGLYMTAVLRPMGAAGLIPLMVGVAVAETIRVAADIDARLKWPNDILIDGKKVGGILAEMAWLRGKVERILLGVGVNLNNHLPPSLCGATTLSDEKGAEIDINGFIQEFLNRLEHGLYLLEEGPNGVLDAWRGLSSMLGKQVEVTTSPGNTVMGVAVDIDQDGALVLDVGGRRRRVVSGSLRDATVKF